MTHDPLDALRAAWRRLEPPPADRCDDAATRAVVDWMRGAWRTVQPPRAAARRRRFLPIPTLVAAAAVLAVALLLHAAFEHEVSATRPTDTTAHALPSSGPLDTVAALQDARLLQVTATLAGVPAPSLPSESSAAPDSHDALLDSARSGNRQHAWGDAAAAALLVLAAGDSLPTQRCEAIVHLVHAYRGLGLPDQADAYAGELAGLTR